MRNFKYSDEVFLGILLIIAVVLVLVANGNNVLVGCGCVALGLAILEIGWIVKKKADKEMFNFEIESHEILKDIAEKEQDSEYFGIFDIESINKLRIKLDKRNKKQIRGCVALGIILIIIGIICMF